MVLDCACDCSHMRTHIQMFCSVWMSACSTHAFLYTRRLSGPAFKWPAFSSNLDPSLWQASVRCVIHTQHPFNMRMSALPRTQAETTTMHAPAHRPSPAPATSHALCAVGPSCQAVWGQTPSLVHPSAPTRQQAPPPHRLLARSQTCLRTSRCG